MVLGVGIRLGAYEITGELGAGGMGEVYRATDTNLKRDVAVKVLPESFSADADRLSRFRREAEVLASLNHPNIAQIHGFEETDGATALIMELVEGPTLADRIAQGPIAPDEAIDIAMQIADALAAAHAQGIVHRDVKPANIKLRSDGIVKVLDFGIAKASASTTTDTAIPSAAQVEMTRAGTVLGTTAYMSPEQARGKPIDKRADIWAFGCVLYEMLTGQPAFGGEDTTVTLARVLERDTDMNLLPAAVPQPVRNTLALCLQKDPRKRLHDMGDVRLALEGELEALPALSAGPSMRSARRRTLAAAGTAFIAGGLLVGLTAWTHRPQALPKPISRFEVALGEHQTWRNWGRPMLAVSRDGRRVVYNTRQGLYLRSLDALDARVIPGTEEDLTDPFLSPDGRQVAFFAGGQLKRVPTVGGAPTVIADGIENPFGASWNADGTILFGQTKGILRVPASGGTPELVVPAEDGETVYGPELLPDGDSVLFSATRSNWDGAKIIVQSLSTSKRTVLVEGGSDAHYLPTGHLVYAFGDKLFGIPFDADGPAVTGEAVALVQGLLRAPGNVTGAANYGVGDNGTLVYATGDTGLRVETLVWVDEDGREEPLGMRPCMCAGQILSPDGTRMAVTIGTLDGDADIWIWSLAGRTLTRLTSEPGLQMAPLWTPDGQRIVYRSPEGLYWRNADGTGTPERLLPGSDRLPWSFTADDRIVVQDTGAGSQDVGIVSVAGDHARQPLLSGAFNEGRPTLSPTGNWLAYESDETGRREIYVRPFPNVENSKWQVSTGGGEDPKWSRDGHMLYFLGPDSLMAASVETGSAFRWQPPKPVLTRTGYVAPPAARQYDISSDGKRLLMLKDDGPAPGAGSAKVVVVENWLEELKRSVPTK